MLGKHIIGYIPSLLVPALASFSAVFCYTRLLTPHQYGHYALALNSMTLLNAVFFYWLQMALPRLMPEAVKEGRAMELRVTAYIAFIAVSVILVLGALIFIGVVPLGDVKEVAWLAVPLALARSLLNLNEAFHRSQLDFRSYNIIECGQAALGLGLGLILVYFFNLSNLGAVLGMIVGMLCMLSVDLRMMLNLSFKYFSRQELMELMRFGLPLMLSFGLSFSISTSDRFLIEHFRGAADVGIYAAAFTLTDRISTMLFMMVAIPSFPLTVYRLEHEGMEAARKQTYANGVAVLSMAMPACVGLILCNHQLASVLIGPQFREGAMRVMPWIASATIFNGLSTHYFDHAFHLAKKPHMLLFTQGPTAAFNLIMNLTLIPKYGYMGAVYSNVCSYMLLLTLSICVGRRVFRVRFPFGPALKIACAVGLMAAVLLSFSFPATIFGLMAMMAIGGTVYVSAILLLNVMDVRAKLAQLLKSRRFL